MLLLVDSHNFPSVWKNGKKKIKYMNTIKISVLTITPIVFVQTVCVIQSWVVPVELPIHETASTEPVLIYLELNLRKDVAITCLPSHL